jgi:hypothetical protein
MPAKLTGNGRQSSNGQHSIQASNQSALCFLINTVLSNASDSL